MASIFAPSEIAPKDVALGPSQRGDEIVKQEPVEVPMAPFLAKAAKQNYLRKGFVVLPGGDIGDIIDGRSR